MANNGATNKPQSLIDYRNADSLELIRLDDGSWEDVDEIVRVDHYDGRPRITVRGRLHGPTRLKNLLLGRDVEVEIIPTTDQQQEAWGKQIRALVAPWNMLQQEMKDASGVEELEIALGGLPTSRVGNKPSSMPTDKVEENWLDNLTTIPEQMQKLSIVDELIVHGIAAVETGATLTKLVAGVERVAETAEFVADASKCIAGVSTIFHLVVLGAQGVLMCAEANRGRRVLPVALGRIVVLLRYVLESVTEIMKPSQSVNELEREFVFRVLRQTLSTMNIAEAQLLRGRGSQIMNAEDVKDVERKIEELEPLVVSVSNTSRICALSEEVTQLRKERETGGVGPHHVRPSLSTFFSGRKKELKTLGDILEKWGSAAITQYGGLGKTELMIAFADRAERDGQVPGGVFWVTVDGGERDVIGSLAGLAEKLTRRKMSEEERRNGNLVIASLKQGLGERQGRWLLCLDNADNKKLSGILNEVCGIAEPSRGNGWVMVTSRQGQPHTWDRMKSQQKLALEPLCAEDAMVALWRQIQKMETAHAADDKVMTEIKRLEVVDQAEHCALKKLCRDDGGHGLGGLPLALVQAGSFIAQFDYSFVEYLNLFESANKENWQDVLNNAEELKSIRESQRSIWTTWKISVQKLSGIAHTVLRAMAMLGQGGIGEAIVKGILKAATADRGDSTEGMLRNVIVKELMHGSSLIWRDEGEDESTYSMHRLVRRFILGNMVRGSVAWNYVYTLALFAVYENVETELENEAKSFRELPFVFGNNHCEFAAHTLALVHHHVLSTQGGEVQYVSEVEDIHRFSGKVMRFLGKAEEEVEVWERLLTILHHPEEETRRRRGLGCLPDVRYRRNRGKKMERGIADALGLLGAALMKMGKLSDAASKLELSLEMKQAIYKHHKSHPEIAVSLDNLGIVYERLGKPYKALEKHEKSLQMKRVIHGANKLHPDIAASLNNLGLVYEDLGEFDKALENHKQSLEMNRQLYGNDTPHSDIAVSLSNLGNVYQALGKLDKALQKHEQSLKMKRVIYGIDRPHPAIAGSLNNLGCLCRALGKLDEAYEKHQQSLEMKRAIHGTKNSHPDIACSLNNLGLVYRDLGKLDKAKEKCEQGLDMYKAIHGHNKPHPDLAASLNNLALVYEDMCKLDKVVEMHEQGLEMERAIHGSDNPHPAIAVSMNNLGLAYRTLGKLEKALEMHEKSLKMYQTIHGQDKPHHTIALSLRNLGLVYEDLSELGKAMEKFEQSLEMYRAIHGRGGPHPDTAISLCIIGVVHYKQKELNRAAEFLEQGLEMLRIVHGRNSQHPHINAVLLKLADVYEDQGRREEALAIRQQNKQTT